MNIRLRTSDRPRRRITVLSAVVLLLGGGVAFAYWTTLGSGNGNVSSGQPAALVVHQTNTVTDINPGKAAQGLSGNFDNAGPGRAYVTSVTVSIDSVTKASGAPSGTCNATDYTLAGATMSVGAEVAEGNGVGSWSGATIAFNNKASNQDACKGATVHLAYAVS